MSCILLQGNAGTGKTFSLRTILHNPNTELFLIELDPGGDDRLIEALTDEQKSRFHVARIAPAQMSFQELSVISKTVNEKSFDDIANMKSGIQNNRFTQFVKFLSLCHNFTDTNGKEYGSIQNLQKNQIVAVDSLTGLNQMVTTLMVGARPNLSQGEYLICQGHLYQFLSLACFQVPSFIMIAHIEREIDELTGRNNITTGTIGRKLAPKLPPLFGDVILATRSVNSQNQPVFSWSTISNDVNLKTRILPVSNSLEPDFSPWLKGLGIPKEKGEKENVTQLTQLKPAS